MNANESTVCTPGRVRTFVRRLAAAAALSIAIGTTASGLVASPAVAEEPGASTYQVAGAERFRPSADYGYQTVSNYDPNPMNYGTSYTASPGTPYYMPPKQGAHGYLDIGPEALPGLDAVSEEGYLKSGNAAANYDRILRTEASADPAAGYWVARFNKDAKYNNQFRTTKTREFAWSYQARGGHCVNAFDEVRWDPFNNRYACLPNVTYQIANFPGFLEAQERCHAINDRTEPLFSYSNNKFSCTPCYYEPFYDGTDPDFAGTSNGQACGFGGYGFVARNVISGARAMGLADSPNCLPTEPRGLSSEQSDRAGSAAYNCDYQFYAWANDPIHPDGGYFPPAGTGGGGEQQNFTITASATATAEATEDAVDTASASVKVQRSTVTVSRMFTFNRKKYPGTGTAPVVVTGKGRHTAEMSATETATETRESRCTRTTMQAAQMCAQEMAEVLAQRAAQAAAEKKAKAAAEALAEAEALRVATNLATSNGQTMAIPPSATKAANAAALRAARADAKAKASGRQ